MTWTKQRCVHVFEPVYFTKRNANFKAREEKQKKQDFMQKCCSMSMFQFLHAVGGNPAYTTACLNFSAPGSHLGAEKSLFTNPAMPSKVLKSIPLSHNFTCVSQLRWASLPCTEATEINTGPWSQEFIRASCFLLTACNLQSQHLRWRWGTWWSCHKEWSQKEEKQ